MRHIFLKMHAPVAADIPAQVAKVSCVWQRGSKLQYTNAAPVDTERKAYWNQVLKVVSTVACCTGNG